MRSYRIERANAFILEEIALLLQNSVRDPRVEPVTVTSVEVTRDRRSARIYVACYSGDSALKEALEGLESAKGFLRRELGQLLGWRFTPQLEFRVDRSWEYGAKIDTLLEALEENRQSGAGETGQADVAEHSQ